MEEEKQRSEARIKRHVEQQLGWRIKKIVNNGRYTSKAYRAYAQRLRARYLPAKTLPNRSPESFAALGAAMAEMITDTAERPGFMRRVFTPNDPSVIAWREEQAEIDRQVNSVMATVLPYSRHIFYPNK